MYALLIVQPILGVVMTMVYGHGISFFGLIEIPPLLPASKPVAAVLGYAHSIVAWVL